VELYLHSPNTPSWRCAQLKSAGTTVPFTFYVAWSGMMWMETAVAYLKVCSGICLRGMPFGLADLQAEIRTRYPPYTKQERTIP